MKDTQNAKPAQHEVETSELAAVTQPSIATREPGKMASTGVISLAAWRGLAPACPGERDTAASTANSISSAYGKGTLGTDWYSFDHNGARYRQR
jgi:hypothetical protein